MKMIHGSIVTIVLAALAAFVGARLGSHPPAPQGTPLSERVFQLLDGDMDLSPAQRESIVAIGAKYAPRREELRSRSRALNVGVARLMAEEEQVGPQVRETLQQLQDVMGERLMLSFEYMLEVRGVLDPAQKARFDERLAREASLSR